MKEWEMYLCIEEKVDDIKDLLFSQVKISEEAKEGLEGLVGALKEALEGMEVIEE